MLHGIWPVNDVQSCRLCTDSSWIFQKSFFINFLGDRSAALELNVDPGLTGGTAGRGVAFFKNFPSPLEKFLW